ncbi:MAG TPA: type II toxin-antitoxin system HicA family toxin [Geobacteraceae bacterium]
MTGKELIKLLQQQGWILDRIQGSHHILIRGNETLSVPVHGNSDLKKGTLHAIKKQGGLK